MKRKILVIDIGGTRVKLLMSPRNEREFPSGSRMGPAEFVDRFKQNVRGWNFDVASIGLPAPMRNGRIVREVIMNEPPLWASWFALFLICALCLWLLSRKVKAYEVVK